MDLSLPKGTDHDAQWSDPRAGELHPTAPLAEDTPLRFSAPVGKDKNQNPWDWVLILSAQPRM
jgi:hypothetical protein